MGTRPSCLWLGPRLDAPSESTEPHARFVHSRALCLLAAVARRTSTVVCAFRILILRPWRLRHHTRVTRRCRPITARPAKTASQASQAKPADGRSTPVASQRIARENPLHGQAPTEQRCSPSRIRPLSDDEVPGHGRKRSEEEQMARPALDRGPIRRKNGVGYMGATPMHGGSGWASRESFSIRERPSSPYGSLAGAAAAVALLEPSPRPRPAASLAVSPCLPGEEGEEWGAGVAPGMSMDPSTAASQPID